MLASELITQLNRAIASDGDLEVHVGARTLETHDSDTAVDLLAFLYEPASGEPYIAINPDLDQYELLVFPNN